ncbi:MAG: erythromycin esterase family protein [Nitrosospira sp.]
MSGLNFDHKLIAALERQTQSLPGFESGYGPIIRAVRGDTSGNTKGKMFVLIGEATHGTAEFYRIRAEITRRLILEEGFDAIAVEADWPDACRVNRYVSGQSEQLGDMETDAALSDFERFPTWMWRNTEVQAFVKWLHDYSGASRHCKDRTGRMVSWLRACDR